MIKVNFLTEETTDVVIGLSFYLTYTKFVVYDGRTTELKFCSHIDVTVESILPYTQNIIGNRKVLLVTHIGINIHTDDRVEMIRALCVHYSVYSFQTDVIDKIISDGKYFPYADTYDIYTDCMKLLMEDCPVYNHIRPYMCTFTEDVIDIFKISNPLRIMYRYVDMCEGATTFSNGRFHITHSSSIMEVDLPTDLANKLVSEGNYKIWIANRLNDPEVDKYFRLKTVDSYIPYIRNVAKAHDLPDNYTDDEICMSIRCSKDSDFDSMYSSILVPLRIWQRCADIRSGVTEINGNKVLFSENSSYLEIDMLIAAYADLRDKYKVTKLRDLNWLRDKHFCDEPVQEYDYFTYERKLYDDEWARYDKHGC